jgi:hypothetical protein
MIVAIHQPNYLPWFGYFHKIAVSDVFIILDDVQFSKSSYTNRVKILRAGQGRWLTQPVSVHLGDLINHVRPAQANWVSAHLDTLKGAYYRAAAFKEVWPEIQEIYENLPNESIAVINQTLIQRLCGLLNISTPFKRSSDFSIGDTAADDRIIELVTQIAPGGSYLSGHGGASYQDPAKFEMAGISLEYTDFQHPIYRQQEGNFAQGLSVVDAAFHIGWRATAGLISS